MTTMCIMAANYLINRTNEYNASKDYLEQISMTCKRLQKLLYFSEVYYMQQHGGQPMLKDNFYAWPSGPVIPSVYDEFVQYQDGQMMPVLGAHESIDQDTEEALNYVFNQTLNIETEDLVEMSHASGGPWNQVYDPSDPRHLQVISKESMYEFYSKNNMFQS